MKKIAFWLMAATPALVALPVSAATHEVATSEEFQVALQNAAQSQENDTIILQSGATFQTINNFPFAYNSADGGDLTIEAETGATLDGGKLTEVLNLTSTFSPGYGEPEDTTLFTLKNITIQNGLGNSAESHRGAGLTIKGANAQIQNSSLKNNQGAGNRSGAAIYFSGDRKYTLTITNTEISGNKAEVGYPETSVFQVFYAKNLNIKDGSKIEANNGKWGIVLLKDTPMTVSGNTLFKDNISPSFGVIKPSFELVKIKSSRFINNKVTGTSGSGVLNSGRYQIEDTLFEGNSAPGTAVLSLNNTKGQYITNSRFINNKSETRGIVSGSSVITNSLFQGNTAEASNGTVACYGTCQIVNSMFIDNTGGGSLYTSRKNPDDMVVANSVFIGSNPVINFKDGTSRVTMNNNFFDPAAPTINPTQLLSSNGNLTGKSDPGLDSANNFTPVSTSVLIDAGTSDSSLATIPDTDLKGNARIADDNVDIGWIEFGSSNTLPMITKFKLLSEGASNLDLLLFSLEYQLTDVNDTATVEFKTDETDMFESVELNAGTFEGMFLDGGHHTGTVKVTNSYGESTSRDLSFRINTLNTTEVIDRIELSTKGLCANEPEKCGINTQDFYDTGRAEGISSCKRDPKSCDIDTDFYVQQGKNFCTENPTTCGINTGAFDESLIPGMDTDWELFGTGQTINNVNAMFSRSAIVWARVNGEWAAYSADPQTQQLLRDKKIAQLTSIPANSGFWVKK